MSRHPIITLFGTPYQAKGNRDRRYVEVVFNTPFDVNWESLPKHDKQLKSSGGDPIVEVRVTFARGGGFLAKSFNQIREHGLEWVWRYQQRPKDEVLQDLRQYRDSFLSRFNEDNERVARGQALLLMFHRSDKGEWICCQRSDRKTRPSVDYVPHPDSLPRLVRYCHLLCTVAEAEETPPPAEPTEGFKKILVHILREVVHPDILMERLERELAQENPD